ncbi:hypothetical protein AM228_11625 [Planktothricoides sp. SR001]|nr:hypothetical protein AM228_11625 [Planktothricoides sp. SR001]
MGAGFAGAGFRSSFPATLGLTQGITLADIDAERVKAFREWAASHSSDRASLSDKAISRESI